jgi:hypothetical protein
MPMMEMTTNLTKNVACEKDSKQKRSLNRREPRAQTCERISECNAGRLSKMTL